jgi:hypothetical protein
MKAMIIYESMFGNTREAAEAIAEGLGANTDVTVVPVWSASVSTADLDLLIVGAPTHAHSLSRPASRVEAGQWAEDTTKDLRLEPNAEGMGVREWLESCVAVPPRFAAFDTRADIARVLSGSAAGRSRRGCADSGPLPFQCHRAIGWTAIAAWSQVNSTVRASGDTTSASGWRSPATMRPDHGTNDADYET